MQKRAKHREVKFSAEEMAYDAPAETDFRRWKPLGRGMDAILAKRPRRATVELDADVARVFGSSELVNEALRALINAAAGITTKRKIA